MKFLRSEKADAEVIGHVIMLGLTITGIAMITLVGLPTIYGLQDMAKIRNVEQSYTVMDARVSKVALGDAPLQVIDVNLRDGLLTVIPNSSSYQSYIQFMVSDGTNITNISLPMGKIVYKLGEREVAYEGGGVWSKYPDGSVMLSPPEFNYNGVTTTLPVVSVTGNFSAGGKGVASLKIRRSNDTQIIYPNASYQNPIPDGSLITITIKSDYYDGWGDFFDNIPLSNVNEFPADKKVVITLEGAPLFTNFTYGALASQKIEMRNNAETDSYNSSLGPYSSSQSDNGSIRATEEIELDNGAIVHGTAETGGDITGSGTITEDAYANSFGGVTINGNTYPPVEEFTVGSTTNLVQGKINEYQASNDNDEAGLGDCLSAANNTEMDGSGTGWASCGGGYDCCTISRGTVGNYYLTKFDLTNKKKLTFDTSSGSINLVLDSSDFEIDNSVELIVSGNEPVRIYMNREIDFGNNIEINRNTNDTASLFQMITSSPQKVDFGNNDFFCGFIWAPDAEIEIDNNVEVYGALVGKRFELENNEFMHYDEDLKNLNTDVGSGTIMSYLYITQNELVIDDE